MGYRWGYWRFRDLPIPSNTVRRWPILDSRRLHHSAMVLVRRGLRGSSAAPLGLRGCHAAAFRGAAPARLSALAAMLHLAVLGALFRARFAEVSAGLAYQAGPFAAARHVPARRTANGRAVDVERDASRHGFDVGLLQARNGAVIARLCACVAGINAGLELLLWHGGPPGKSCLMQQMFPWCLPMRRLAAQWTTISPWKRMSPPPTTPKFRSR